MNFAVAGPQELAAFLQKPAVVARVWVSAVIDRDRFQNLSCRELAQAEICD